MAEGLINTYWHAYSSEGFAGRKSMGLHREDGRSIVGVLPYAAAGFVAINYESGDWITEQPVDFPEAVRAAEAEALYPTYP